MANHKNRASGLVAHPGRLSPRDVVVTCMANNILSGVALSDWDVGNARQVIDECMSHVQDTALIAEFWRSTTKGYYVNTHLTQALLAGTRNIPGLTDSERAVLAGESADSGNESDQDDTAVYKIISRVLNTIGAADLHPLAGRAKAAIAAICETL